MAIQIQRTNHENSDFIKLVKSLDNYLKIVDGEDHNFYNQFNHINTLKYVIVLYFDAKPVGCGAIKHFDKTTVEIKRMYVSPENRGSGIAKKILLALETWARELGYKKCILETGKRQIEAVKFYAKCNYKLTPNYGQYKKMSNSLCLKKILE